MTELAPAMDCARPLADLELRRSLSRFVEGRLRDSHASEDLVQETYLRLYDYGRTRTVANVGAFCFAIARNLIHDYLRRARTAPTRVELADEIPCPAPRIDEVLAYRERVDVLVAALRHMPPLRREVFTRQRLDGDAVATIAAELDLSRAAVEKHVTRAVADLRHALERRGLALEW
ncbi:RNA polymerase sigma factor [Sphingomonas nostoxanthinifaciens]|uniref:RNA polymerase sigma factor n=1 Tax=Sphingomonas nostoxanthinifaciens TaxID=2872652 RepID=UPI001CC1DED9|nr:sigma-70 family RNA polymerase sigma factor [Sphingomonas nostoxanthinifaciens]UAK22875.1 sigma-70 family RNA polymerase sigma factor [Sphingomonas nostoxanthinifaciens]